MLDDAGCDRQKLVAALRKEILQRSTDNRNPIASYGSPIASYGSPIALKIHVKKPSDARK